MLKSSSSGAGNTTRTVRTSRMGTRSQAKHSGLKWGSELGSKTVGSSQNPCGRVDDLDVSPISSAPQPTTKVAVSTSLVPMNTRELRKTTVLRSKVKSPINQLKTTKTRGNPTHNTMNYHYTTHRSEVHSDLPNNTKTQVI